jgi:hypothetical protein
MMPSLATVAVTMSTPQVGLSSDTTAAAAAVAAAAAKSEAYLQFEALLAGEAKTTKHK